MTTKTRLPYKTIASLREAFRLLDATSKDLDELNKYLTAEVTEAKMQMDSRRQAKAANAATALAQLTHRLLILERVLSDARRGHFEKNRY